MEYDRFTSAINFGYESFFADLKSLYLEARLAHSTSRAIALMEFGGKADKLLKSFLKHANQLSATYSIMFPIGVQEEGAETVFSASLRALAVFNVASVTQKLKLSVGTMLTRPGGAMAELARVSTDTIELHSKDAAGRTWKSSALVRTMARDFAYQRFIDHQAYAFGLQGSTLVKINYLDQNHQDQGLIISLGDQPGYVSLQSVRRRIFHPNASATLSHV